MTLKKGTVINILPPVKIKLLLRVEQETPAVTTTLNHFYSYNNNITIYKQKEIFVNQSFQVNKYKIKCDILNNFQEDLTFFVLIHFDFGLRMLETHFSSHLCSYYHTNVGPGVNNHSLQTIVEVNNKLQQNKKMMQKKNVSIGEQLWVFFVSKEMIIN